ncbi:MAG: hypothetical protein ACM3MK_11405 [Chitinophagales bacterium]
MIESFRSLLKINSRVIILVLLLLVVFDLLLRVLIPEYINQDVRRLPADNNNIIGLWKDELARCNDYKVVFIGDSVVFGGGVREESQTLPSYFSQYLKTNYPDKNIKVFNFSQAGCTPADTYQILRYISDARPDLVIYDGNLGWFDKPRIMEHPYLIQLNPASMTPRFQRILGMQPPSQGMESTVTRYISNFWMLYRARVFLDYWWLGQPPKEKMKLVVQYGTPKYLLRGANEWTPEKTELYKNWTQKDLDSLRGKKVKLGYFKVSSQNPQWMMYEELMLLAEKDNIPMVMFFPPRNRVLMTKYNLLDEPGFNHTQQQMAQLAEKHGVTVLDYTWDIDSKNFVDSLHLDARGNRDLARLLSTDLASRGLQERISGHLRSND